jgi:simple sugar transport system ATP-binding protein
MSASTKTHALLEARGLTKHYGTIRAAHEIDLAIGHGEIVAVVGDNGAGKSTLIKMLSGAVEPDAGEIEVDGVTRRFKGPNDARAAGIETLYQDLALLPNLDAATNLFLGRELVAGGPLRLFGFLERRRMRHEAAVHLTELHIDIPKVWGAQVESLSGGQRQSVAIARALVWASKLLIMDEPTAALGVAQSRAVLDLVRRVRERGTSVIVISHILPHVIELADRVVVMRHGGKVADLPASDVTQDRLIELIIGYERSRT